MFKTTYVLTSRGFEVPPIWGVYATVEEARAAFEPGMDIVSVRGWRASRLATWLLRKLGQGGGA